MASNQNVTFKVFRFDPEVDAEARYQTYDLNARPGMTVLEGLVDLVDKIDHSLAFRYSCRGAVCGSCAMYINGSYRLACETQISPLVEKFGEVVVSPLPHLSIIRDLVVDMGPFFERYEAVRPYLIEGPNVPERENLQSPEQRKKFDEMINCILCGCCYSSCPTIWSDEEYLGPAALVKAYRFVADSRDHGKRDRLNIVNTEDGAWRCHTIFNCAEACPKEINCTYSIQQLKRQATWQKFKFWES
jgi:succinate dehydrogenase / fumarate reductase, iron-sulfur subunit